MVFAYRVDDGLFGDIKGKAGGDFEKGLKHGNWPDSLARLFAEGFDETSGPDLNRFIGDSARGPGLCPEPHCLGAIGCL